MAGKERLKTPGFVAGVATPNGVRRWIVLVLSRYEEKVKRFTWVKRFPSSNTRGNVMVEFLLALAAFVFIAIAESLLDESK